MFKLLLGYAWSVLARDGSTPIGGGSSLLQTLQTHQANELKRVVALPDQGTTSFHATNTEQTTLLHDVVAIQGASLLTPEDKKTVDGIVADLAKGKPLTAQQ